MLHTHIALFRDFRVSALISAGLLVVLAGLFFFPTASMEETKAAPASGETTLSMTAENVNLDLNITNPNGTFSTSTPSEFTVSTSSQAGYTLRLQAKDDNSDSSKLVNGEYAFNSISSASADGTDFNNGNWGIKPSKFNSTDNTNFLPAPNIDGVSLDETDSANVEANTYTLALAAKSDYTLPAGIYSNTFVLTATANGTGYTIIYDGHNEYDEVENLPEAQTVSMTQPSVELSSQVPTLSGYQFFGWCDGDITTPESNDVCSGDVYQPGDTFVIDASENDTTTLYAMWGYSTITFDGNGGEIDMYDITWDEYSGSTIDVGSPYDARKSGYVFNGWNTKADGTGASASCTLYEGEESYIENCSINTSDLSPTITTLYAQWTNQVTVHFYADSSYATGETADQIITIGTPTRLNPHTFTSNDYILNYWYSDDSSRISCQNECEDEDIITISDDVNVLAFTLHSEWTDEIYVIYDGNGADWGSMEDDEHVYINYELSPNTYERSGYVFNGWNTKADGTGQVYGAHLTPSPKTKRLTLYAQWRPAELNTIGTGPHTSSYSFEEAYAAAYNANNKSIWVKDDSGNGYHQKGTDEDTTGKETHYAMQDITLTLNDNGITRGVCDAVTAEDDTIRVLDTRDWKVYWILKAKDGKCWMTQNLDLDLSPDRPLTSLDTDLNDASLSGTYEESYTFQNGVITWTPKKATTVALNASSIPNDDNVDEARSTDVGNWYYTDTFQTSVSQNYLSSSSTYFSQTPFTNNQEHGHVGNYYNWTAAVASDRLTVEEEEVRNNDYYFKNNTINTKAFHNSICPKGWRLPDFVSDDSDGLSNESAKRDPSALAKNEFYGLIYYYSNGDITEGGPLEASPLYFTRAGTIRKGGLSNAGYDGYYWASQRNLHIDSWAGHRYVYSTDAYNLIVRSNVYDPANHYTSDRQRSVRCVARNESENNMEDIYYIEYDGTSYRHVVAKGGSFRIRTFNEVFDQGTTLDYTKFLGWNTEWDGSGTSYQEGELVTNLQSDLILYPMMSE